MTSAAPPRSGTTFGDGLRELLLSFERWDVSRVRLKRHHIPVRIRKYKHVATRCSPKSNRSVLNCGRMLGGHERTHNWQIGHQLGGMRECALALALHVLKRCEGVLQVLYDLHSDVVGNYPPDDHQARSGETTRDQQQGE